MAKYREIEKMLLTGYKMRYPYMQFSIDYDFIEIRCGNIVSKVKREKVISGKLLDVMVEAVIDVALKDYVDYLNKEKK